MKNIHDNEDLITICICFFVFTISNICWSDNIIQNDDSVRKAMCFKHSCQIENKIDSATVIYWNAFGCNYDQYTISYSSTTGKMIVYVDYLKKYPAYCIDSLELIELFLSSMNDLYLEKNTSIIENKIKHNTNEHVEYEIPTFHVECFKNGKQVLFSSTCLDDGNYELVFNQKFTEFKDMVLSIVEKYDKYLYSIKNNIEYKCIYY